MFFKLIDFLRCKFSFRLQIKVIIQYIKVSLPKKLKDKYLKARDQEYKQVDDETDKV